MPISLRHKFISPKPDTSDPTIVQASSWNDEHDLIVAGRTIVGRAASDAGQADELSPTRARNLLDLPHYEAIDRLLINATDVVGVHVYNTLRDYDGGAWTTRCDDKSWANETLGTATRGVSRSFPKIAGLVLQAGALTIFDLADMDDNGSPRLWMEFSGSALNMLALSGGAANSAIHALDGRVAVASSSSDGRLTVISFTEDRAEFHRSTYATYLGTIADRNAGAGWITSSGATLPGNDCRSVHSRALPGALLDGKGLPIPTILVTTNVGVSVRGSDGSIVDIARVGGFSDGVIIDDETIVLASSGQAAYGPIPTSDVDYADWSDDVASSDVTVLSAHGDRGGSSGAELIVAATRQAPGLSASTTTAFATGWLPRNTRLALAESGIGDLSAGTVSDRSTSNNPLTVNGTISRTLVATGSSIVALAGFSSVNYLSRPFDADFDIATGDFSVMGWVDWAAASDLDVVSRGNLGDTTGANWAITSVGGALSFVAYDGSGGSALVVNSTSTVRDIGWFHFCIARRAGFLELWINGEREARVACAFDFTNATAILGVGALIQGLRDTSPSNALALIRFAASSPIAADIRKIHRDEAVLFEENAPATLAGLSDVVRTIARDENEGLVLVGTDDGVSVFSGLRRVDYIEDASSTLSSDSIRAVSASNGVRLIASVVEAIVTAETRDPTTEINRNDSLVGKEDKLLKPVPYEDRGRLRNIEGFADYKALVAGLGLFHFDPGSVDPDDDETCFRTTTGAWLLEAASPDFVHAFWLPEIEDIEARLASAKMSITTLESRVLYGIATSTATTVASLAQHVFTTEIMGAALGDRVVANPPHTLHPRLSFGAYVSATNIVTIFINNPSAAATGITAGNAGDGEWSVSVFKE